MSGQMLVQNNSAEHVQLDLPSLDTITNGNFSGLSSINIPSLQTCLENLTFAYNYFTSLSAPNLIDIDSNLSIDSSPELENISFPSLSSIGGNFHISNNSHLLNIDGFGHPWSIGWAACGDNVWIKSGSFVNVAVAGNLI